MFLKSIINGKNLKSECITPVVRALNLKKHEAWYFRALVRYNQEENPVKRERHYEKMLSECKTPSKSLDKSSYGYYKNWYTSVIRAVINTCDFNGSNCKELAEKLLLPVSAKQVCESLKTMKKLGLIHKDEKGYYRIKDKILRTRSRTENEILHNYMIESLEVSRQALKRVNVDKINLYTNVMSVSEGAYAKIKKKIDRLKEDIRTIVHTDEEKADRVCQLNIQMVPHFFCGDKGA